jgi:chemotaxis protein MotB
MSDSISSAFRTTSSGAGQLAINTNINPPISIAIPTKRLPPNVKTDATQAVKRDRLRNMAKELNKALAPLVDEGKVKVTEGALGITVDINASVLFASGDARLDLGAVRALAAVAQILAPTDFPIIVEGHTDNTPINTAQFPSNWELSGMRASSVVRLFIETGVDGRRLTATGYADQRPLADNATADGRQRNRRVAITIESRNPDNPVEVQIPE